jgi:hypothetical protein
VERARVEIDRGRLLDEVLDILADSAVSDADAGRLVRDRIGMSRLQAASRPTAEREPRDHGHFDLLAARYKYLRTFTAAVIAALPLTGNTASPDVAALLDAVRRHEDESLWQSRRGLSTYQFRHHLRRRLNLSL